MPLIPGWKMPTTPPSIYDQLGIRNPVQLSDNPPPPEEDETVPGGPNQGITPNPISANTLASASTLIQAPNPANSPVSIPKTPVQSNPNPAYMSGAVSSPDTASQDTAPMHPAFQGLPPDLLEDYLNQYKAGVNAQTPSQADMASTMNNNAMLEGIAKGANTMANIKGEATPFDFSAQTKASNELAKNQYNKDFEQYLLQKQQGQEAGKQIPGVVNEMNQAPLKQKMMEQSVSEGEMKQAMMQAEQQLTLRKNDPNSNESRQAVDLFTQMGGKSTPGMTASQVEQSSPTMTKIFEANNKMKIEQMSAQIARENRLQQQDFTRSLTETKNMNRNEKNVQDKKLATENAIIKGNNELVKAQAQIEAGLAGNNTAANMTPVSIVREFTNRVNQTDLAAASGGQSFPEVVEREFNKRFGTGASVDMRDLKKAKEVTDIIMKAVADEGNKQRQVIREYAKGLNVKDPYANASQGQPSGDQGQQSGQASGNGRIGLPTADHLP